MKKLIISAFVLFFAAIQLNAQNPKLQQAIGKTLGEMAAAKTADEKKAVINALARIADAEPTEAYRSLQKPTESRSLRFFDENSFRRQSSIR